MEKSALKDSDVNYDWNFLNYPIHTVSVKPEKTLKECAILLIHGFGASTDHWRFYIPILSNKYEVHAMDLLGFGKRLFKGSKLFITFFLKFQFLVALSLILVFLLLGHIN